MSKNGKFALGALVGAGLGLLFATKTGKETRKNIALKVSEIFDQLKDLDMEEVKTNIEDKIEEIKKGISGLEKEKVLEIAKEKGEALKVKAEELTELAKKTGKPIVKDATTAIKGAVLDMAKEVVNKLETKKDKK